MIESRSSRKLRGWSIPKRNLSPALLGRVARRVMAVLTRAPRHCSGPGDTSVGRGDGINSPARPVPSRPDVTRDIRVTVTRDIRDLVTRRCVLTLRNGAASVISSIVSALLALTLLRQLTSPARRITRQVAIHLGEPEVAAFSDGEESGLGEGRQGRARLLDVGATAGINSAQQSVADISPRRELNHAEVVPSNVEREGSKILALAPEIVETRPRHLS